MSYTAEKIYFALATASGSGISLLGAILNDGDSRYLYVTLALAIITAAFCAITFKTRRENMRTVAGRSGFAMLGGVFGTRFGMHKGWLPDFNGDVLLLGGLAIVVTLLSFFVGFWILHSLNRKGRGLADKLFGKWTGEGE